MTEAPKWFLPVTIAALLWNLMGCAAYISDAMLTAEQISQLPAAQQALYADRPFWAVGSTAIAVWLGAIGCVVLAFKKKFALPILVISLLGIVVQDLYLFVLSDAAAVSGSIVYILQGLVLVVGVALIYLANTGSKQGWLS